jgi:hypothetical protein
MPGSDNFDFDSLVEFDLSDSGDDFFSLNENPQEKKPETSGDKNIDAVEDKKVPEQESPVQKRSSADFSPDMDALLLTAQSSMIIEAMKSISQHDFKSKNLSIFSEAIKGVDLYIKILERNPENFKKLSAILSSDTDCMDVQRITFNLFRNVSGELPQSDSQKLKAFELIKEKIQGAYYKSLISLSIINIKKYYLLTGSLDTMKIEDELKNNPTGLKKEINNYIRHINIGRHLIKTGNSEIVKGMKGKELNTFIVKASYFLHYYFGRTGEFEQQTYYARLHDNFKNYFIIK